MPASLPGTDQATNTTGNPSAGNFVMISPMSGPKGSPFDNDKQMAPNGTLTASGNASTGGLSTGIGFGSPPIINQLSGYTAAESIRREGWEDDIVVGAKYVGIDAGIPVGCMTLIGGGRSDAAVNGYAAPNPYTAGTLLLGAGNGGSRDAGAGPAFTGFTTKPVTATGAVANGAAVETGWLNRSGVSIAATQSVLGSSTAASAAPA